LKVKGLEDVPEKVVDLFVETYPYAGGRLQLDEGYNKQEVLRNRMLLLSFWEGFKVLEKIDFISSYDLEGIIHLSVGDTIMARYAVIVDDDTWGERYGSQWHVKEVSE